MTADYSFDTFTLHTVLAVAGEASPEAPGFRQGSGVNASTNATTFSEDISQGLSRLRSAPVL